MTPETIMGIGQEALMVTTLLAAPLLISALTVGVLVGMFQAATQINEMTLSFVPKLLTVAAAIAVAGGWMLHLLVNFTEQLIESIPSLIG
ncbi:MAG: flagellar biosynthesis protein FliQ [Gammaproteobacteria bacterium]